MKFHQRGREEEHVKKNAAPPVHTATTGIRVVIAALLPQQEMGQMWRRMDGILSAGAQQYLDEVAAALARNDAYVVAAMANCPYEPIYRTRRPLDIGGTPVPADVELHWNFHTDQVEYTQRFGRTGSWQECMEDDRGPRRSSC